MKKFIYFALMALIMAFSTSCNGKKEKAEKQSEIIVENTISADREYMFLNFGENYLWFETCITLKNYLDEENDGEIESLTSIFEDIKGDGTCFDTKVIESTYTLEGHSIEVKDGFWVGDKRMNSEPIPVTFKQAFEALMASDFKKPHSRQCVLRKEIGPKDANVQYIFGNVIECLYVDAVTGEVSETSPAYPEDK